MRTTIHSLPGSQIRDVANAAMGQPDVLAFWFGESDEVTPEAVREAAARSLRDGETFYAHNLGLPVLRESISRYVSALHGRVPVERIAVTSSGVSALMLAMQMLVDAGDEVAAITPLWPNLTAQAEILGARVQRVALEPRQGQWTLDMDRLRSAVGPGTRVLLVNAPNNPTGWTLGRAEVQAILDHCRITGTWIVADEVYERLYYGDADAAPSFLDLASPDDRVVVVQSFSKSFLMTGWRLGWVVVPPHCLDAIGKLIEFNTSCAPVFVQRGGFEALRLASALVPALQQRMRRCRDELVAGLGGLSRVTVRAPLGGMYAFLRIDGVTDSLAFARALVIRHGLGLAPGSAFGPEGQGWLRWCFASRDTERLHLGVGRLGKALESH
jgi:aspartate/methionine/tyrosine aminotransferase